MANNATTVIALLWTAVTTRVGRTRFSRGLGLREDVQTIRRRAGPVPVVLLADGAPELWRRFEQHLNEKQLLESREKAWPGTFRRWKSWLLTEAGGAERVLHALMSSELQNARDDAGK